MSKSDTFFVEAPDQVKIACEHDCETGFDVYLTKESMIVICRGCSTEYEISSRDGPQEPDIQEFQ